MLSPLGNPWKDEMRSRSSLKGLHAAAVDAAESPIDREALRRAVPGLTVAMVEFLVRQRLLLPTERGLQAVPGLRVPKHRAPPQALQASSVWEYARRWA